MEFKIQDTNIYGVKPSIVASGNSMSTTIKSVMQIDNHDIVRAETLAKTPCGTGHDQFLTGIVVQMTVYAPLYWWKQAQRYNWFTFVSSQSTMHCLSKFNISEQCVGATDPVILKDYQRLLDNYNAMPKDDPKKEASWRTLVASLPCGFILGAAITTNYRQLKTMYAQRKNHRLPEWHSFCAWCESLPYPEFITQKDSTITA